MVDLLEVSLFAQLVVSGSCFLSNDPCLIQLFLQHCKLIRQLGILSIDLGDIRQVGRQQSVGLVLAHLLLKRLQGAPHAKLDEEVSDELITLFA